MAVFEVRIVLGGKIRIPPFPAVALRADMVDSFSMFISSKFERILTDVHLGGKGTGGGRFSAVGYRVCNLVSGFCPSIG